MRYKLTIKIKFFIVLSVILLLLLLLFLMNKSNNNTNPDLSGKHLVVYSCLREEETKSILELFKLETNCSYEYIQLPTQEAISRIEDEKKSPKADIFLSGTKLSLQKLNESDSLISYIPKNSDYISPNFKSRYGKWTAFEVHPFSIIINKDLWYKNFKDIDLPKNFKDLSNPKFKGSIAIPNPLTSGTGYSFINHLYENLGENSYKYIIKKIKNNSGLLTTRGYNVVQNVASGEYAIGIAYLSNIKLMQKTESNFIVITPKNFGMDIHGIGIINKNTNLNTAKAFTNFIISKKTQEKLKDFSFSTPILDYKSSNNKHPFKNSDKNNKALSIWKEI